MELQKRKQNRLTEYDYSTPNAYFITICTRNRKNLFWTDTEKRIDCPEKIPLTKHTCIQCLYSKYFLLNSIALLHKVIYIYILQFQNSPVLVNFFYSLKNDLFPEFVIQCLVNRQIYYYLLLWLMKVRRN